MRLVGVMLVFLNVPMLGATAAVPTCLPPPVH